MSLRPAPIESIKVTASSAMLLAMHAAQPERYPVLLESVAQGGALGRFDILLAFPGDRLALRADGRLESDLPLPATHSFFDALDQWWLTEKIGSIASDLPFTGGWFLFLGYELAAQIEPSLRFTATQETNIAEAIRIPAAIIRRHADGASWIVVEPSSAHLAKAIAEDLTSVSLATFSPMTAKILAAPLKEDPPENYLAAVRTALEHIAAGDVYQANLSRGWHAPAVTNIQAYQVYERLRHANPAPFAGLAVLKDRSIISSTPERLLEVRNNVISTRPIAGTRARGLDQTEDLARLNELYSHPKERAEHVMLIDLERNDLGRICEAGTVEVSEFMTLESYAHVHHIASNVRGKLRPGIKPGEAIAAVFPGGTITGCPKVRCMQIISDTEQVARGAYTGSMGYLNRDGSMDLNILIRTLELRNGVISFRAGAGIVADSIAERELDETRAKAQGLIRALADLPI